MVEKKVMTAREMEQWLVEKGVVPVSKKTKKEPWFKEVSKLPPCLQPNEVAESALSYQTSEKKNNRT